MLAWNLKGVPGVGWLYFSSVMSILLALLIWTRLDQASGVVIGVIVTEMLASLKGIGFWISYHRTLFNTGHVYLGMLLALSCALIVNWVLSRLETKFGQWRELEKTEV